MATFTVTNTNDSGAGSLRQAIIDASNAAGDDTVEFDPATGSTFILSTAITATGAGITTINGDVNGDGDIDITISGNDATHMLNVATGASVVLKSLAFTNGSASISHDQPSKAGAIVNSGTLAIEASTFANNTVNASGDTFLSPGSAAAGAILNQAGAALEITESAFTGNSATAQRGSGLSGNGLTGGHAGTIVNLGNLALTHVLFSTNSATGGDGGNGNPAFYDPPDFADPAGNGGAGGSAAGAILNLGTASGTYKSTTNAGTPGSGGREGEGAGPLPDGTAGTAGDASNSVLNVGSGSGSGSPTGGDNLGTMGADTQEITSGTFFGLGGRDFLTADGGGSLFGGAGNDDLTSLLGTNIILDGGLGDDTYHVFSFSMVIQEDAGEGTDTVEAAVNFTLAADDDIEDLRTNSSSGTNAINLTGNALVQTITGNAGDNIINGGVDDLEDLLQGLGGDDTYVLGASLMDTVDDSAGTDTVTSTITRDLNFSNGIENLTLLGSGAINGSGTNDDNSIRGNGNSNELDGLGGSDDLYGAGGNDVLNGGDVSDSLEGGSGNDSLRGNAGGDTLDGGSGIDTASYYLDGVVNVSLDNTIVGTGAAAGDSFFGVENISGSNIGNDTISGNGLVNSLAGNGGNDAIYGRSGDDTLTGGLGRDFLVGGGGKDRFDFNSITESTVANRDRISGFNSAATDRIDLSTIDAKTGGTANDTFAFVGTAAFTALGQVRAYFSGGDTVVDMNTTGTTAPDMRIVISGNVALDALDFVL